MKKIALILALATLPCFGQLSIKSPFFVAGVLKPVAGGGGGDITDSMRAWWKFDDGSGTTAVDSDGNTYPGTLEGSTLPTWDTGHINGCLDFGNADSSVNIGATFLGTGDKSVTFWCNIDTLPATRSVCGETKFLVTINTDGYVLVTGDGGGNAAVSAMGAITTSAWKFVAVTVTSAGTCNIYVDGSLSGSANQASGTPATSPFNFEIGNNISASAVDGKIDDVRIYDRILSAGEIDQIWDLYP